MASLSSGDPDVDAVFSGAPAAVATSAPIRTGDPDVDAAIASFKPSEESKKTNESPSLWNRYLGFQESQLAGLTGGVGGLAGGLSYLGRRLEGGTEEEAQKEKSDIQQALTYQPRTETGKKQAAAMGEAASYLGEKPGKFLGPRATDLATRLGASPQVAGAVGATAETAANIPQFIAGEALGKVSRLKPGPTAQEAVNQAFEGQSMGAAGTAPNVGIASPQLQQAIATKGRNGAVNPDVLQAHLEADTHGVQLTKGQATQDPVQVSEERNHTDPRMVGHFKTQEGQMVDAIDNLRREASPSTVGNDVIENGQTVVDALKAHDEPVQADIRAKYKALTDANGGNIPIDTGSFLNNIDAALKKNYLTKSVPAGASELLDSLRSNEPLDFEGFEAARSRLAEAQRNGGSEGAAAKIIRGQLEQLPLSPEAANLKGLADNARAAAKSRFDALDADPAYQAAVDDVANGVKRGQPSPLADRFLDKYVLGTAPKANVDLMMGKLDPDAQGAVTSHTLNAVRKSAVTPNGTVSPNGYNGAMQKYAPKLDSLVAPEVRDNLESLGRTITRAKVAPPGNYVNYSKSGVIINAAKGAAEHAVNAKTLGVYGLGKKLLTGDRFVKEALEPGAGLDQLKTAP